MRCWPTPRPGRHAARRFVLRMSLFQMWTAIIGVPAGIHPLAIAENKYFGDPAAARGCLPLRVDDQPVLAPDDRHISEVLNTGPWEFQADKLPSLGLEFVSAAKHRRLVHPVVFSCADHNCVRRNKRLEARLIIGEPRPPDDLAVLSSSSSLFACAEQQLPASSRATPTSD